jgi:hypothetical protein
MGGVKPWQIVVIALAILGASGSIIYSCSSMSGEVKQANTAKMVDIRTGDLFEAPYPKKAPVMFPAKNPSTGNMTLYPVFFLEEKWVLDRRYLSDIKKDQQLKADLIVDSKSGEIKATGTKPKAIDIFGK